MLILMSQLLLLLCLDSALGLLIRICLFEINHRMSMNSICVTAVGYFVSVLFTEVALVIAFGGLFLFLLGLDVSILDGVIPAEGGMPE